MPSIGYCALEICAGKQKTGENMNRKIMILMVAVVATVLPAVAVADVMITGSVSVHGSNVTNSFYLTEGPNYAVANQTGVFGFVQAPSGVASMGTVDIEGMSNLSVSMINVLEFNYSVNTTGTIHIVESSSHFPKGSYMSFSPNPMTSMLGPTPPNPAGIMYLNQVGGQETLGITSTSLHGTFYIGFYLPAGTYSGASVTFTMTYSPS